MSIVVDDFHKIYGQTVAVSGLSFAVAPGEILGLVGPNGAGKTTTLRALAGVLVPTRGRLLIAGHDLATEPVAAKAALAYVPDEPRLFDQLTVWEHLRFTAGIYRVIPGSHRRHNSWPTSNCRRSATRSARSCRAGMRQKVAVCCAYLHQPRALMLDEPLTGLDPYGIRTMKETIRRHAAGGAAVIVSSHLLSLVEDLCTSVLVLHRGRQLLHSPLAALRQQLTESGRQESLEELFFRLTGAPVAASDGGTGVGAAAAAVGGMR